jgi:hypothetical protein
MSEPFRGVVNLDIRGSTPDWAPFSQPVAHRGRRTWCTRCSTTSASGRWATAAPYRPTVATITGKGADSWPASSATAWLTHVLVEQHPDQQGERIAPQQLVGRGVLGEGECRHPRAPAASARRRAGDSSQITTRSASRWGDRRRHLQSLRSLQAGAAPCPPPAAGRRCRSPPAAVPGRPHGTPRATRGAGRPRGTPRRRPA